LACTGIAAGRRGGADQSTATTTGRATDLGLKGPELDAVDAVICIGVGGGEVRTQEGRAIRFTEADEPVIVGIQFRKGPIEGRDRAGILCVGVFAARQHQAGHQQCQGPVSNHDRSARNHVCH
jgi:hypothetical protein